MGVVIEAGLENAGAITSTYFQIIEEQTSDRKVWQMSDTFAQQWDKIG